MADEIWRWDAGRIAKAVGGREISAREAVSSCMERMHAVNPALNAVTLELSEQALAGAAAVDAAIARGEAPGPLAGVPVTIKQNVDQAGCPTSNGVVAFEKVVATEDSPVVANWKAAGALVIGRTNCPAFSVRWNTGNDLFGQTYNPWSRAHTPGGSSGGASAAVAAGIGPLAHGNDLGGSVRYPAYACGIVGLRPSFGRVPAFNPTAPAERPMCTQMMSVQGPLARTVADIRLGLAAMAARDPRDPWWVEAPLDGPAPAKPIRVAVITDPADLGECPQHPDVLAAVRKAAAWLSAAGYAVEEVKTPGFTRAARLWGTLLGNEIRVLMLKTIEAEGDADVRTAVHGMIDAEPVLGVDQYMASIADRTRLVREWFLFLERYPLVLSPVSAEPPFAHGFDTRTPERMHEVLRAQTPQAALPLLGLPGIAVPTGIANGLPTGVQIMAGRFREDLCLDAAAAIEARAGVFTPIDPRG
ncbi:MAG: amidase family protein [Proteobacteria bacterium]|nr:amidase family protein [Pseudomonadota bacterium]